MNPVSSPSRSPSSATAGRLAPVDVLLLSAWCGLATGELEVAGRFFTRSFSSAHRLLMITRHFVWLIPSIDLALFLGFGVVLALATRRWPRAAAWCSPRLIVTWSVLPVLATFWPRIYWTAWLLVALGVACRVAPLLERHPARARRWMARSAPVLLGLVLLQASQIGGGDWLKQWREERRPLPPDGSPNVLLIVLDTVRADHLSAYRYPRATTPTLERLAARGIRFDEARAPAPWTLASHASFFTGCWPHELGVQWAAPWPGNSRTLAEYLGTHGYATAGFVANAGYCSYETGLARGFTHYEDYVLEQLDALRTARLIDIAAKSLVKLASLLGQGWLSRDLNDWFFAERKSAEQINHGFLDWLDRRREPGRPVFAFLNYLDAHAPYLLPPGARHRFGANPNTRDDFREVLRAWSHLDKRKMPHRYLSLARGAYDDCLAYLDEQLGALFDELQLRGILERTLVIVTSDHGEGLGEHGLFQHGVSLYRPEIRVPLLILLPSPRPSGSVVRPTVSLRDLPATIVDLIGLGPGSPFPGRSLARFWANPSTAGPPVETEGALSELTSPNPDDRFGGRSSPAARGPLIALAQGDFVYIRNEGDGREELFHQSDDPDELNNLAHVAALRPILKRFRDQLPQARAPAQRDRGAGAATPVAATPRFP
jgi:arylsulfatase A-like enzyme